MKHIQISQQCQNPSNLPIDYVSIMSHTPFE